MKLFKRKLQPTRDLASVEVVADLDALVNEEVAFRLQGKTFYLKPLSAGEAFVVWQNLAKLDAMKSKNEVTFTEVLDFYAEMFSSVCPDIKRKHVEEMSQAQCAALLQLILDTVTGRVFADAKKKAQITNHSTQHS